MKLWLGKEMEGEYKDTYTLFVGSPDITFEKIKKVIIDRPNICQLYFGAGGCTKINRDVVRQCKRYYTTFIITLEIDVMQLDKYNFNLLGVVNLIVTFNNDNVHTLGRLDPNRVQIKIQTEKPKNKRYLALAQFNSFDDINTDVLLDKTYKGDIVIK